MYWSNLLFLFRMFFVGVYLLFVGFLRKILFYFSR